MFLPDYYVCIFLWLQRKQGVIRRFHMFWDVTLRVCVRFSQRFKGKCQFFIVTVRGTSW